LEGEELDENIGMENTVVQSAEPPKKFTFFGSYSHSIDAKGRIIIPNAYRDALGSTFTIGPTRDFNGIALYPDEVFDEILAELSRMNQRKPFVQSYTMQFYKLSYRDMEPDAQGRLLLPPKLRQRILSEAKDLEISGGYNHVRIVDAQQATEADQEFMANKDEILEELGDLDAD
jgi:MraZ protein